MRVSFTKCAPIEHTADAYDHGRFKVRSFLLCYNGLEGKSIRPDTACIRKPVRLKNQYIFEILSPNGKAHGTITIP